MALQDRFDALTPVAVGSPGRVWRARRRDAGDVVAVTLLDVDVAEQAPRVAVRLAQVDDPHLVHVLDVVNDDGHTLLVEQWIDGATLDRTIGEGGEISAQHAIATTIGILDALSVAHENGVAHGDLRPEVVLIEAATGTPRVFGFGLGKVVPGTRVRGTAETIAPEVITGRPADPRSDVYGAGCLLFWLLTGQPPFPRATAAAMLDAHLRNPMPWLPGAPSEVRQVLRAAMAKDPHARYATTSEMADALHAAASRRYAEGWDDVSSLSARAAGVLAEVGPAAARSQGEDVSGPAGRLLVTSDPPPLRPAMPRTARPGAAPTAAPLPPLAAAPLPDADALSWSGGAPPPDVRPDRGPRARPVTIDEARVARNRGPWATVALVLIVLGLIVAGGVVYWQRHHASSAAAAPLGTHPSSAEPTPGGTGASTEGPQSAGSSPGRSGTAAPSAFSGSTLAGRWSVTDTVTSTRGNVQGSDGKPLRAGAVQQRTYVLTWRCTAPSSCTATVTVRETGRSVLLTGDGTTFEGSVSADVDCGGGKTQPVTASMSITITGAADGRATAFSGTTSQVYEAAGSCPAARVESTLSGSRT